MSFENNLWIPILIVAIVILCVAYRFIQKGAKAKKHTDEVKQYANDLGFTPWAQIAKMCPVGCKVSHLTEEDYIDAIDDMGLRCKRATHHYVPGQMTVVEERWGWRFYHPGFKEGYFFSHALSCGEETPSSSHIAIYSE